jgi:hypothetical protein
MKAPAARLRVLLACSGWALLWLARTASGAAYAEHTEAEVKAAFVLNFVRYTDWPPHAAPSSREAWVVGVREAPDVEAALRALSRGVAIDGRPLRVAHVEPGEAPRTPLHVLYSGASAKRAAGPSGRPVLTVGEDADFARTGGVIRVFVEDSRVRFEVNPDAARSAGLGLSSQLLKLARIVGD